MRLRVLRRENMRSMAVQGRLIQIGRMGGSSATIDLDVQGMTCATACAR